MSLGTPLKTVNYTRQLSRATCEHCGSYRPEMEIHPSYAGISPYIYPCLGTDDDVYNKNVQLFRPCVEC